MSESLISAEGVRFTYASENDESEPVRYVLDGVDLDVKKGEFLAVLGHNGSGKSTIAKHFNAILLPDEGSVSVDGINTANSARLYDIRQKVGMVFQNPDNQIVASIVEEDVAFGPENLGVEPKELRLRVDEALKSVGMYEYRRHETHRLSGGQKQRVAIAGMIAMRPRCLVLDEPTAMLDPQGRRDVMKTVKSLNKNMGMAVVFITHFMDEAVKADRIIVIDEGKKAAEGTPADIFARKSLLRKCGLDIPESAELAEKLAENGIKLDTQPLTPEDFTSAFLRYTDSIKITGA